MVNISNRAFERTCCEARIKYAVYGTQHFIDAKMCNSSEGGMYFESDHTIPAGSEIWIRRSDYSPHVHGIEASDGYRAEVMWCRKIYKEDGESSYGVGVRFMVNVCDKCGETVSYSDIHRTDDLVFLCSDCLRYLGAMSREHKKQVEKYLMGNVI
jgi:hypothetical protein